MMTAQFAGDTRNVALLISDLGYGGAERQVVELANNIDPSMFDVSVVVLNDTNPMAENLHKDVHILDKRHKFDTGVVFRLRKFVLEREIELIHSFLFDANIAARLAKRRDGWPRVISSERNSYYKQKPTQVIAERLTRSGMDRMIANSFAGKQFCIDERGMDASTVDVVHNGVDSERFRARHESGRRFRKSFNLPPDVPMVGMIGNYKSQKNHLVFVQMAYRLARDIGDCRFVIVGNRIAANKDSQSIQDAVTGEVHRLGLGQRFTFIESLDEIEMFYNACDLTVLPSSREGTPNVVLESMACGTPVLATDVADNNFILDGGACGGIVRLRERDETAEELAVKAGRILQSASERERLGALARSRIEEEFSIPKLVEKTTDVYRNLLGYKR